MSPAVPARLGHLRTDRRGLPVPFVNRWGPELVERCRIECDPLVPGPAVFMDDSDQETPDFLRQHMARQRECVLAGLCQVCGRAVPWSRRYLVVAPMSVDQVTINGMGRCLAVSEPWLDEQCADFALRRCPALIRRRHSEELALVAVTSKKQVRMCVSRGSIDGPLHAESMRIQPAMWAKIILPYGVMAAALKLAP